MTQIDKTSVQDGLKSLIEQTYLIERVQKPDRVVCESARLYQRYRGNFAKRDLGFGRGG